MKIAFLSTHLPRQCGIATFNNNLFKAITNDKSQAFSGSYIIAMNEPNVKEAYIYPSEVKKVIHQDQLADYTAAAAFINTNGTKVCVLQHEFGIYGGNSGHHLLAFINALSVPLVSILHTVLDEPTFMQLSIIREVARCSAKIVVMSKRAISILQSVYKIPHQHIKLIEHGVPDLDLSNIDNGTQKVRLSPPSLLTFGLISRNKGLETVIKALPAISAQFPDVLYYIVGKTHPNVLRQSGEEYRIYLKQLAKNLGVTDKVVFVNEFLNETELCCMLTSCTLYITPYLDEAQITSGALSYAVGAGAAVLSTPYWHAQELLAEQRGDFFNFKQSTELAEKVTYLLSHQEELDQMKEKALQYGLKLRWPNIGKQYILTIDVAIRRNKQRKAPTIFTALPALNFKHIQKLTDDTGIIQHARFGMRNLKEGYCVDDNARALLLAAMAFKADRHTVMLDMLPNYLSYIHFMQRGKGLFRNFLSFKREYLDEIGSEDSFGRTIWALGYLIQYPPDQSYKEFAQELFGNALPHFLSMKHLRGTANTLIGVCHYLHAHKQDERVLDQMNELTKILLHAYKKCHTTQWNWFEDQLTYDNAILPLSLLCSYAVTGDPETYAIAKNSMEFLASKTIGSGYLNPVGNDGWCTKDGDMALYDQQAIETMGMVLLYTKAYEITSNEDYFIHMNTCYQWFLGHNSLRIPLYDEATGGCCDGLHEDGVNRNQGAESTLAYLIAQLAVESIMKNHTQEAQLIHS